MKIITLLILILSAVAGMARADAWNVTVTTNSTCIVPDYAVAGDA